MKKIYICFCLILFFLLSSCNQDAPVPIEKETVKDSVWVSDYRIFPDSMSSEQLNYPMTPSVDLKLLYTHANMYGNLFFRSENSDSITVPFYSDRFHRHGGMIYSFETDQINATVFDYKFSWYQTVRCAVNASGQAMVFFTETDQVSQEDGAMLALFEDGTMKWKQNLTEMNIACDLHATAIIDQIIFADTGHVCIRIAEKLFFFDENGNYLSTATVPMCGMRASNVGIQQASDGQYHMLYITEDCTQMAYCTVDFQTQTIGEEHLLPFDMLEQFEYLIYLFDDETVYYSDGRSLFRCNIQAVPPTDDAVIGEKLFDWTEYSIIGAKIDALYIKNHDCISAVTHHPLSDVPEIVTIKRVPADTVKSKTDIVLAAGAYNDGSLRALQTAVSLFNRQSDAYSVTIASYDPYAESGFTLNQQIANDMMNGKQIDLILFHRDITMEYFDNLGLLGDWYPLIDADTDYSRDTFLSCVLNAYETSDGTLPVLTTDFGLTTLIGATENLDAMEGWSYSECSEYVKSLDWDRILLQLEKDKNTPESDAMRVFKSFLPMVLDDYIDGDAATCDFDSESFKQLLTLCTEVMINHEAAALKYANGIEELLYQSEGFLNEYRGGNTVLFNTPENGDNGAYTIRHPADVMNLLINFFHPYEGALTCIGYPMPDGVTDHGTAVTPWMQFGLTARAEHVDGAWEFVKGYLDYQRDREQVQDNAPYLPCTRAALDALYDAYLTYEYLMSGTPWLQEYTDGMDHSKDSPYYHDADPRACDLLDDLLAKTTRRYSGNTAIMNILYEEAVYFFDGIQPMEEVTKRMQSRVGIYLSEHQ